jgi:ABC-type Fe3+-hydroxamate transport system substrate-binding protein
MITTIDQLNRSVTLPDFPRKIISVVPSQTELLYSLGLDTEVIGITKFCVHPEEWFRTKVRVGGTKKLNLRLIDSLAPDLIIANKEENSREDIESLSGKFPVWISDIRTLDDALKMISEIGRILNKEFQSAKIIAEIKQRFEYLDKKKFEPVDAIYLIWKNPFMAAGNDSFISHMMLRSGFNNVAGNDRYPEFTLEEIISLKPEVVLLSSEPFPFKDKDVQDLQSQLNGIKAIKVDGEMFSWYGSRLLQSAPYFAALRDIHKF